MLEAPSPWEYTSTGNTVGAVSVGVASDAGSTSEVTFVYKAAS